MPRSIHVSFTDHGDVILDRPGLTRDVSCEISKVPADVTTSDVLLTVTRIAIWPFARRVDWDVIEGSVQGRIIAGSERASLLAAGRIA